MTTYPPDVVPWVPDLERAQREHEAPVRRFFRTFDLFDREPWRITPWAVVELRQRYLLREQRTEKLEVPASVSIGAPPPVPDDFLEHPLAHSWVQQMDAQAHACTGCSFSPGKQSCAACAGSGTIMHRDERSACTACGQTGEVTCGLCNGERECVWAHVGFARDYTDDARRFYQPYQGPWSTAATALREALEHRRAPDALHVSLESRRKGPYRDGPVGETEFYGFSLGSAAESARKELARRERERPLLRDVEVFAWPVLEVIYRVLGTSKRVLLIGDGNGNPVVFVDG